jgi:SAM-dependent methyltransferase
MWNVVQFNWPKYVVGLGVMVAAVICAWHFPSFRSAGYAVGLTAALMVLLPLVVTHIIYDRSELYRMPWHDLAAGQAVRLVLNINAGFDESSVVLRQRFPQSELFVVDLFDAAMCTEASIARARKAHPPYPAAVVVRNGEIPLPTSSADLAVAFLSLHELRSHADRVTVLKEIKRTLSADGRMVITEHLRDLPNTLAFTVGVLHFYSMKTWLDAFKEAGFRVAHAHRTAGFITTFILQAA